MFKLPDHVAEKVAEARRTKEQRRAVFANLSDADLAASAKFWMQHCRAPDQFDPDAPVYDSTFWHVIAPEMIRRLATQPKDQTNDQ